MGLTQSLLLTAEILTTQSEKKITIIIIISLASCTVRNLEQKARVVTRWTNRQIMSECMRKQMT